MCQRAAAQSLPPDPGSTPAPSWRPFSSSWRTGAPGCSAASSRHSPRRPRSPLPQTYTVRGFGWPIARAAAGHLCHRSARWRDRTAPAQVWPAGQDPGAGVNPVHCSVRAMRAAGAGPVVGDPADPTSLPDAADRGTRHRRVRRRDRGRTGPSTSPAGPSRPPGASRLGHRRVRSRRPGACGRARPAGGVASGECSEESFSCVRGGIDDVIAEGGSERLRDQVGQLGPSVAFGPAHQCRVHGG